MGPEQRPWILEKYYKTQFFSVIDLMTNKIYQRFDQKKSNYLISLEELTISAAKGNLEGDVDILPNCPVNSIA